MIIKNYSFYVAILIISSTSSSGMHSSLSNNQAKSHATQMPLLVTGLSALTLEGTDNEKMPLTNFVSLRHQIQELEHKLEYAQTTISQLQDQLGAQEVMQNQINERLDEQAKSIKNQGKLIHTLRNLIFSKK